MTGNLAMQLGVDAALLALVGWAWWAQRRTLQRLSADRIAATLNVLEARARELEKDAERFRKDAAARLTTLGKICNEAGGILDRVRDGHALLPTVEEGELKEAARLCGDTIPPEVSLDLRTLLNEQLA